MYTALLDPIHCLVSPLLDWLDVLSTIVSPPCKLALRAQSRLLLKNEAADQVLLLWLYRVSL